MKASLYFTFAYTRGNVAVGRGGVSCPVICWMCYTCNCGFRLNFISSIIRRGGRDLMNLMEVIGAAM